MRKPCRYEQEMLSREGFEGIQVRKVKARKTREMGHCVRQHAEGTMGKG